MSGGINEALSFIFLMIMFCMYKQREVTQQEIKDKIKAFDELLAKKEAKEAENRKLEIAKKRLEKPIFDDSDSEDVDLRKKKVRNSTVKSNDQPQNVDDKELLTLERSSVAFKAYNANLIKN